MPKLKSLAKVILISGFLAGCASTKGDFCDIASPRFLSAEQLQTMTREQKQRDLAHNEYGEKYCGWKP